MYINMIKALRGLGKKSIWLINPPLSKHIQARDLPAPRSAPTTPWIVPHGNFIQEQSLKMWLQLNFNKQYYFCDKCSKLRNII